MATKGKAKSKATVRDLKAKAGSRSSVKGGGDGSVRIPKTVFGATPQVDPNKAGSFI